MTFRLGFAISVLACLGPWNLPAQETGTQPQTIPVSVPQAGIQIRSVSAYAVYDSSFLPNSAGGFQASAANLPADVGIGGSIAVEWSKFTERSTFSLDYTPSYTGYVRNSNLNALNHLLSLTTSRKLAPRWTLNFAVAGNLSSLEQTAFAPSALGNVAAVPATFNDLSAALLSGTFTNNPQLGVVLSSSPLAESPVTNLIYGQRVFTSSGRVSLAYSYSPRLTVTFSGGAARTQYVSQDQPTATNNLYLLPNTTSGTGDIRFSYSLSPLTQLGGTATVERISSSIFDSYNTTTQVSLGHTFAKRWIAQVHGGVASTYALRRIEAASPSKPGPAIGGSLAYKTLSNTFLGSFDRTVIDQYGLGATTTSNVSGNWRWRHPGATWWLDGSVSWQQLQGGVLANTIGWRATAGLSRALGPNVIVLTQYAYVNYSGGFLGAAYHTSQQAVRLRVEWTPHPVVLQ